MSKIGIATFSSPGHINPSITLASELARRGHEVTFYTLVNGVEKIEAAGFPVRPYGTDELGAEAISESYRKLGNLSGLNAVRFTVELLKRRITVGLRDLPLFFEQDQIDGLVIDQVVPAGAVVARAEQIPYVTLSNALPLNLDAIVPPVFSNLGPARGPIDRIAIAMLNGLQNWLAKPLLAIANRYQHQKGLPRYKTMSEMGSDLAQVVQIPEPFDFPRSQLEPSFHYTGPFHSCDSRPSVEFPWERLSGDVPLIYASMGTLQNQIRHVFETIAEACRDLPVQLVISLGGGDNADEFAALPGNPIVVGYAPQLELLQKASVCITHAGLNTALESIAHGVPMLAIPITNDQPGVGARIRHHGLGHVIGLKQVTAGRIRKSLQTLLQDPLFTENAKTFQRTIASTDGVGRAARLIENALANGTENAGVSQHVSSADPGAAKSL
ncbi:MurG-like transferase [Stieleria maiorica]|uniref:MurG-like transferase n=1 Tax=Stieleria maiorica TaxID=2795974 RepID=A0A5B9MDU2_9BACT|nr:glycosyltransferase [Stieleria maiorica]QEF98973.1 MurG-like transferase [Stieleria maiorica]